LFVFTTKKFTFAISSPDELLVTTTTTTNLWGKTAPFYFCHNFVKTLYGEEIIGAYIFQ